MTKLPRIGFRPVSLLATCWLMLLAPLLASAQMIEAVVLEGDAVPGVPGAFFDVLGPPVINDAHQIAFEGKYDTGGGQGIFLHTPTSFEAIALRGDAAPVAGGGTLFGFFDPAINASGQIAFVATIVGGTGPSQGIFLYSGGTLSALVLNLDAVPSSGGGFAGGFLSPLGLTDAGEAIAITNVSGGSFQLALYGFTTTAARLIVFTGQSAPPPLAGTYSTLGTPGVSGTGDIALSVFLTTGGFAPALVHIDPTGVDDLVALSGDLAPDTGGGTFGLFNLTNPAVNNAGDVAFQSSVNGGSAANGLFVFMEGVGRAAALPGDPAPGTGGSETYGQPFVNPTLDGAGVVGFSSDLISAGGAQGLFLDANGVDTAIAIDGDNAPGVPGSFFDEFPRQPAQSPAGLIAFNAVTEGDSLINGIWTVPEPSGSMMLVAGAIALAGLARRRRRG